MSRAGQRNLRPSGATSRWLVAIARLRFVQTAFTLYSAQFANYLVPLAMVPYLTRTLGPSVFGKVALAQAVGLYCMLVVDYGFTMSATREVARERRDRAKLSRLLGDVTTAKLALSAMCAAMLVVLELGSPGLRAIGPFLWAGACWGIASSCRPLWFFLGLEDVRAATLVDIGAKLAGAGATFLLVRGPSDGITVLLLQGAAALISTLIATLLAYRRAPFRPSSLGALAGTLRSGWSLFLFRVAASVYSWSNLFLLGSVAPVQIVGFYAGAEKIYRALVGLSDPLTQAIYPFASRMVMRDRARAARHTRVGVLLGAGFGLIGTLATYLLAPVVVPAYLGTAYHSAVPILQLLGLLFPVLGMSFALGIQWLFPLGMEAQVTRVSIAGGLVHVPLALLLGSRFGGVGVAAALLTTESLILAGMFVSSSRAKLNPFVVDRRQPVIARVLGEAGDVV